MKYTLTPSDSDGRAIFDLYITITIEFDQSNSEKNIIGFKAQVSTDDDGSEYRYCSQIGEFSEPINPEMGYDIIHAYTHLKYTIRKAFKDKHLDRLAPNDDSFPSLTTILQDTLNELDAMKKHVYSTQEYIKLLVV